MTASDPDKLDTLVLDEGAHSNPDEGMCVMEAVAYIAGEPFTDHPKCASPVIGAFLRSWNDSLNDTDRQILKPYIPQVVGTNTGKSDDETRAWMAIDWLVREFTPGMLRLAGLTEQAELLEQLAALTDRESAERAQPAIDEVRAKAAAAWDAGRAAARDAAWAAGWDAARAAARAAARDAARAAARAAARDAARAAAWDAARDAAWDAAWAAAWDAARDAARDAGWAAADKAKAEGGNYDDQYWAAYAAAAPLVDAKFAEVTPGLQKSALLLLERMIAVGMGPAASVPQGRSG